MMNNSNIQSLAEFRARRHWNRFCTNHSLFVDSFYKEICDVFYIHVSVSIQYTDITLLEVALSF
jgi:hypothetical protein